MRPAVRFACAAATIVLLMGCNGGRGTARYGWLRLQGGPSPAPVPEEVVASTPAPAVPSGQGSEPVVVAAETKPVTARIDPPRTTRTRHPAPDLLAMVTTPVVLVQDTDYYQERPHPWNKVAIVSLPVTLIGVGLAIALQSTLLLGIAGAVGLTLALIGGRHARDHEERGRGYAMPAMIIGAVALFLALLVVVVSL